MHQSGHSRAQSMQTVQFSSSRAITPRLRGGSSGSTSGYCWVVDRLVMVLRVTASPWTSPLPGVLRSPSSLTNAYPAPSPRATRAHPHEILRESGARGLTLTLCQGVLLACGRHRRRRHGGRVRTAGGDDLGRQVRGSAGRAARGGGRGGG